MVENQGTIVLAENKTRVECEFSAISIRFHQEIMELPLWVVTYSRIINHE
jgi:hypothetical protein